MPDLLKWFARPAGRFLSRAGRALALPGAFGGALLLAGVWLPPAPAAYDHWRRPFKLRTIVIDAGHGGKDRGCNGKKAYEADVALKLALDLGRRIEDSMPGVRVIYTRKTNVFVELIERAQIANRHNADLFVSIHLNSGPSAARGTEIWTMGPAKSDANLAVAKRENAVVLQEADYKKNYGGFDPHSPQSHILFSLYQSAYIENSLRFAERADRRLKAVGRPVRGVKQAGFLVLWKTAMPAVLIEAGFLTNAQDERYLNDSAGQAYTAGAIFRAFQDYKKALEALD